MRIIIIIFCVVFFSIKVEAQSVSEKMQGSVSFVSTQNIYVRFKSTIGITAGDTLYISSGGKLIPALKVNNLSTVSCMCTPVSGQTFSVSQAIIAVKHVSPGKPVNRVSDTASIGSLTVNPPLPEPVKQVKEGFRKQNIRGYISAYSYSDFSNVSSKSSTQLRYNLSLSAMNIGNSRFSTESYVSFRHKPGDWIDVKSNLFNALKIYNLNVRFDPGKNTQIILGRRINPKVSGIGSMDGLQFETTISKFTFGTLVGYRPDYNDYSFNSRLFQYGAYVGFSTLNSNRYSESSIAFMQQMNNFKTDRRFLSFQHSNSLIKNLYFLSAFELDLYAVKNGLPQNTLDLTGLFLSLRYRLSNRLSISSSYDERKNIFFYETYKSVIDSLLENERRQSLRLRVSYNIAANLYFGIESGYRFLKTDPDASKNVYGYLTYSRIPGINASITLSGTYLESGYVNGKLYGATISRGFFKDKLQTDLGYRYVDYSYPESLTGYVQHVGEMNLYWQFSRKMSFSVNYEGTFEKQDQNHKIFLQLIRRF